MSLGLESAGFELALANELSPMAAETFAFNHLDADLANEDGGEEATKHVFWLTSSYPKSELKRRLQENPLEFPEWQPSAVTDIPPEGIKGRRQLVVGSIIGLNNYLEYDFAHNPEHRSKLDVDLVSGGPPCQSFSMAGLRQRNNHRNRLPWEFARFVNLVKPKVALLENVSGILRAFKEEGEEFHAWKEVAKAFVAVGYAPLCLHVNAKYVGVPQNRPRFLMFALRHDLITALEAAPLTESEAAILDQAVQSLNPKYDWEKFRYWDIESIDDSPLFSEGIFTSLKTHGTAQQWVSCADAIGDLADIGSPGRPSKYVDDLNSIFHAHPKGNLQNTNLRRHGIRVKQRFRLYQVLSNKADPGLTKSILGALRSGDINSANPELHKLQDETLLFADGNLRKASSIDEIVELVSELKTRKHSQKPLSAVRPAPAALSIPDDCCHYSEHQLRTLSVREVARIQSFPDGFVFRSKETTGGTSRKFQVPQYTQVGNAVPPLLARQAGEVVKKLLELAGSQITKTDGKTEREISHIFDPTLFHENKIRLNH